MRRAPALVAVVASVVTFLVPCSAPLAADTIGDKKAEAERITRQLAEQGRQISILAEEYNLAVLESQRLEEQQASATSRLEATDGEAARLRGRLKAQAVDSYVRGGAVPALAMLVESKLDDDIAIRREYIEAVTNRVGETLDELRAVKLTLEEQRDGLERARGAARDAVAAVEAKRERAIAAQDAQERLLKRVEGELAALVAAAEKRRAEAEAKRVQAELAARRAREEAAGREAASRAAATTTTTARRSTTTTAPGTSGTPDPAAPPPPSGAAAAVEEAKRQLGKPYEYGGSGPDSFDCSGLTSWAWRAGGKSLPHSSQAQWSATSRVSMSEILPGDLLFYGDPIHHVGLYVGDGQMIEAPETGKNVRYASIFRSDIVGAGRVN